MRRIVLSLSALIAWLLWATAPAGAQGTASVTPANAGKPSTLHYDVDGLAPPIDGRLPSALQLTAPSGFRMDLDALAKRCSEQAAKLNECPRGSLMGTGSLQVIVTAPDGVREVDIALSVYLQSRTRILAVAYVFGWQVVPATLDREDGIVIDFDPLPTGPPFPGVSYALKRITLDFGATRVIRKRKVRRVGGKRRVRIVKRRAHLITNPRKCEGTWELSIALRFPDGSVTPLATPTTCTPA
jgi:hypothetical protein